MTCRKIHTLEAEGRSAAERHRKYLELLTCSAYELRHGPDHLTWNDVAANLGPFTQASVIVVHAPHRSGEP